MRNNCFPLKLQLKFVIYNALSKAIIIAAFGLTLPVIVQEIVYKHIDNRLEARRDLLLKKIALGGLDQALLEEDCSFDDYNIFKEEFIKILPIYAPANDSLRRSVISDEEWSIEETSQQMHRVIRQPFLYDAQWYELNIGEGLSSIDKLKNTISQFTFGVMIIVIILSIFLDIGFVQILLKPFNRIVSSKLKPASDPSKFDITPVKSSTYEFAHLDESINVMMKKIKDAFAIEREFISNVSHELLTPITILQTRLENILSDEKTPEPVSLKIIESQKTLNRLRRIIKSLLMISKIENAQYLKNESCEIRKLVNDVAEEIEDRLSEKNVSLSKIIEDDFVFSPCNNSLLHTMLFNLVNNAVKYNNQNGSIHIKGRINGDHYLLQVTDTGIGIDSKNLDDIFNRFKKIHKDDENSFGLGLPIVKTIANFHRIRIEVNSEPGKGSSFNLLFPVERSASL